MKRKFICGFLVILMIMSFVGQIVLAVTQSDKAELQEKINSTKNELEEIQGGKNVANSELDEISKKVTLAQAELNTIRDELAGLNAQLDSKKADIEKTEKEVEEKTELLKARMVALYEAGDTTYLDVLVSSENLIDFISGFYIIEEIAQADTDLIDSLESQIDKLEAEKKSLEDAKVEVEAKAREQEVKTLELENLKAEKERVVATLSEEEQAAEAKLKQYDAEMERVNAALAEAARKAQQQISGGSKGGDGLKFDGSFIWPCNNKIITSRMKWRWGRQHKGIDIGASYENVYASASGYAYKAYDSGGYGNYIMIFHGSGYVTLYGHLNSYKISDGQYVSQGQVIAQSGNTGGSTGPHLHFEIRKASSIYSYFSSSALDPLDYLPGGYSFASGA